MERELNAGVALGTIGTTIKDIAISKVENGFVISIGCKRFVGKSWEEVSEGLKLYFENPEEAQKKYCK